MPRTKNIDRLSGRSDFNEKTFKAIADDLKSGRIPLRERMQVSDDMVTGLRASVHKTGLVSYAVHYYVGEEERPLLKIGEMHKDSPLYLSLDDARHIAKAVKSLGEKGINVEEAWTKRLIRELKSQGSNWRPDK